MLAVTVVQSELDSSSKIFPTSVILEKIKRGEAVDYDYAIFEGPLDLGGLNLPTDESGKYIVHSPIKLTNSEVRGTLSFNDTILLGLVHFNNTSFDEDAHLWKAQFCEGVCFKDAHFGGIAGFEEVMFDGPTDFENVTFNKIISFENSRFNKTANFNKANFNGGSDFIKVQFVGDSEFFRACFNGDAYFTGAKLSRSTKFSNAKFIGNAYFNDAEFGDDVYFYSSEFEKYADFRDAQFRGDAIFGFTDFSDDRESETDFKNASFFRNSNFSKVQFSQSTDLRVNHFSSNRSSLDLTGSSFGLLKIEWNSIEKSLTPDGPSYIMLVQNFKNLEQFEDALGCYYQYRNWKRSERNFGVLKLFDIIAWVTCGYGVRSRFPIFWSLLIIISFGLIFISGIQRSNYPCEISTKTPSKIDAINFSTQVFISLSPDWQPIDLCRWKLLVIIERLLGWLFLALFLITLSNEMINWTA